MAEVLSLIEDRLCAEKGEQERGLRLHSSSKKDECWRESPSDFGKNCQSFCYHKHLGTSDVRIVHILLEILLKLEECIKETLHV